MILFVNVIFERKRKKEKNYEREKKVRQDIASIKNTSILNLSLFEVFLEIVLNVRF